MLINGNGCKILITNPRLGFLDVNTCSNVIVENFFVDHDPLPYTQGTVTHNFFTNVPSELAIEFLVDTNYPAPTNANYIDANASNTRERWGTVMNPTNYGRGADNRYSICFLLQRRPDQSQRRVQGVSVRITIRPGTSSRATAGT